MELRNLASLKFVQQGRLRVKAAILGNSWIPSKKQYAKETGTVGQQERHQKNLQSNQSRFVHTSSWKKDNLFIDLMVLQVY